MANYPPNVAGVASISSGEGVIVNNADPENPIVGLTVPVSAADGGTGLTASGTDASKYLKSDGSDGWELGAPVSAVTASAPLASSGGASPNITLDGIVAASHGGTGLSTSGVDATKYLKSNGTGGWSLATPAGAGTVTSIAAGTGLTASPGSPITDSGTISLTVPIALGNNSVALVTQVVADPTDPVTISASVASAHDLVLTGDVTVDFDFSGIGAGLSVSTAVLITTDSLSNVLDTSFASVTGWLGVAPTLPTTDVASTQYLVVATNIGSSIIGSWQKLV